MEIWKIIKDYPKYEVSNLGRIRINGYRIREWDLNLNKYIHIRLMEGKRSKTKPVHILVIEAFIDRPDYDCEVNHKDCNKSNNCLDNLEYTTHAENMEHARLNGKLDFLNRKGSEHPLYGINISEEVKVKMKASHNRTGKHPNYVLTDSQVHEIKKRRFNGSDMKSLSIEFKQTITNISLICSGKRRSNIAPEYTILIKKYRKAKRTNIG